MFVPRFARGLCAAAVVLCSASASAQGRVSYVQALSLAKQHAPGVAVARATEGVAEADSRAGGLYPNPILSAGTSTQTARLSVGASVPLLILGQRGAALDAGRAELSVAKLDTQVSLAEVRAGTGHAFVTLWLAERTADARAEAATISRKLESAVNGRVELGSSPEIERLRANAEALRADLDSRAAADLVDAASTQLAAWMGADLEQALRVADAPQVPTQAPTLEALRQQVTANPGVLRATAEVRASEARVANERAQVRPLLTLDLGADMYDPTLPAANYRAQLGVEMPIFNQRGPLVEREQRRATVARSRASAEQVRLSAALIVAYRTFGALSQQARTLADGVVPAAVAAARATEESYTLGRAPLVAVLDAERARIDAQLSLIESQAALANAWIDVELALGVQ
ncbi:MAG: TolC family protein [Polyangiaceae bacterium]